MRCIEAGRASGDLLAPLVYCPELHFSEYTSAVADMKNSVSVCKRSNNQRQQIEMNKRKSYF